MASCGGELPRQELETGAGPAGGVKTGMSVGDGFDGGFCTKARNAGGLGS